MSLVRLALLMTAVIHVLPVLGVFGAARLRRLYGVQPDEPNLELLLRHRAVLFGLLAGFLAYAAFAPELHRLGLIAGLISVGSFVMLSLPGRCLNQALTTVFKVDLAALAVLLVGVVAHLTTSQTA